MHFSNAPLEGTIVCLKKYITLPMFYLCALFCKYKL